jgi:hypothetical protein
MLKDLMKKSAFLFFVKDRVDHLIWKMNILDEDDPLHSMKSDYFNRLYVDGTKWESSIVAGFQCIAKVAKRENTPVLLVIFPIMYDFGDYRWTWIHEKVTDEGKKQQFHIIDLFDAHQRYPVKQVRTERGDFVHPNALGHHLAAQEIWSFLTSHPSLLGLTPGVS